MDILKNKSYKSYNRLSRYSTVPYYYNTRDKKYVVGTGTNLDDTTNFSVHKVIKGDTYDTLALRYYNNPTYFWIICDYNRIQDPFVDPEVGTTLYIPLLSKISFL